jgi:hypothetical protein
MIIFFGIALVVIISAIWVEAIDANRPDGTDQGWP